MICGLVRKHAASDAAKHSHAAQEQTRQLLRTR